jgi:peptidoglycan/LPS O-acetylase OafA/YrhL
MIAPWQYIFSTLFYFTNWLKALHLQPDSLFLDHTWSLSIEEQYYILWPIVLTLFLHMKISKKNLFLIPFFLGLASALARGIYWNTTQDWFRVYMGTDLHADGLLLGSSFGLLTMYRLVPKYTKHKLTISLTTVIAVLLFFWLLIEKELTQSFIPLYGNLGISLGTIIIISRLVHYPSPILIKIFSFSPLVKTGIISYGLYLWHAPMGEVIDQANLNLEPSLIMVCKVIATFLAAGISYFLVEKPFLRLKDRLFSK